MADNRIGVWMVGARGSVAATAITGIAALRRGLASTTGLVSELPPFAGLPLPSWEQLVVAGHDIRDVSLVAEIDRMAAESRVMDRQTVARCESDLRQVDERIRSGTLIRVGEAIDEIACDSVRAIRETPREAVARLQEDMRQFVRAERLSDLIVVNVASTEPAPDATPLPGEWAELSKLLDRPDECPLPASSLYAIAGVDLGYPYLNFTPSLGSSPAAIRGLAVTRKTCHMGCDGKTGETLLKSVLAPMFAKRNLEVMSWVGHNIFGNLDGVVLDDPANKRAKVASKDRLLGRILGYSPQTLVSIEYIESLNDWKTAWDHVHFRGFLGTPMTLEFTWHGCDSILAAPLVLDLIRFTALARRRRTVGLLTFLSSFFKSPLGDPEDDFSRQFDCAWALNGP